MRDERGQQQETPVEQSATVEAIPLEDLDLGTDFRPEARPPDPREAIETDLQRARRSLSPYRESAYLDAADKLVGAGRLEAAGTVLNATDVAGMAPVLGVRKRLLRAEIDFERGELDRAGRFVEGALRVGNIDPIHIADGLDLKARIELQQGHPLEAAKAWVRRDDYLTEAAAVEDNHARIWFALGHLNELALQLAGQSGAGETLRGWLDLAILFLESAADQHELRIAVTQWSQANSAHPASGFARDLLGPKRAPGVQQLALLLPLSSNYGAAARTVYNGFEAAYRSDGDPRRPRLVFYDIGGEPALAGNYVGVSAAEGADVIVGPLGKDAVNALLDSRTLPRPMVLLGSTSVDRPLSGVYQFDLAPEPEARQAAEFMYVSGHRRVAVLYPNNEWGQRVQGAFSAHWESLGGELAEARAFEADADDHTSSIKDLFNLTDSETRHAVLEAATGLSLDFNARRRQDIDALFMAARPDEARLLKPQIDFFQGLDLPVYSTSHVYAGRPDPVKDTDLDGISFPHMPWTLHDTARVDRLKEDLSNAGFSGTSNALFAFGYDAYRLALVATDPSSLRATPLPGLTAELTVGDNGHILRALEWAEFRDGAPVRIWQR